VNFRDVVEEGEPVFKLGRRFVIDFSSRSEELATGYTWCCALDSPLERYGGEGGEMRAGAGALA
jgi:hypothetical protein